MKKKIILIISLVFFLLYAQPIEAARSTIEIKVPKIPEIKIAIPSWFNSAIQPLQDSIKDLKTKVENLQNKVNEIETKLANLNGNQKGEDFSLPESWNIQFFQPPNTISPNEIIMLSTSEYSILGANHCNWKGANIDSTVIATIIGHLPSSDIYGAGTCKEMVFENITNLPESGKSFDVDIHLYWQGTNKYKKINITIPERPFPARGNQLLQNNTDQFLQSR